MSCKCVNVDFGTYKNTVELDIPHHMEQYKKNRNAVGLSLLGKIMIDKCIADQILYLCSQGITTYNSCCGHNKLCSSVIVDEKDVKKMLQLGYENLIGDDLNSIDKTNHKVIFYLKGV